MPRLKTSQFLNENKIIRKQFRIFKFPLVRTGMLSCRGYKPVKFQTCLIILVNNLSGTNKTSKNLFLALTGSTINVNYSDV